MATASEVLALARNQIGYKEGKNNSNKYGAAYGWNNVAWCCQFIWWLMTQKGVPVTKTASCTALWNWAKGKGLSVSEYSLKPGDIVFFDFGGGSQCNHVGIVESVGSSRITTIEGNTSSGNSGSQSNGDGVYRRYRYNSQISHAYRPQYDAEERSCTVTLPEIKKGSKGSTVKAVQILLNAYGYNCGTADGDFGTKTHNAVVAFQKAKGLGQDGIVGTKTYGKLLK